MDELIRSESTGTAKELAYKLSISRRHVYNYLKTLNSIGRATRFDTTKNSYVYKEPR
ncbi:HTH domain-containing protein [Fulvivirga sp. 29W222]|uniref:HTH domain-containing protein n=1 Tax=Fulvivirga marina TaxID=2494733 RepID=A0A937KB37_9BACT|nr:HTH domain-containing protein [Fulvivirga marina]MBL6445399.1 HTH domain-containing protein [Fulvivirga marina]